MPHRDRPDRGAEPRRILQPSRKNGGQGARLGIADDEGARRFAADLVFVAVQIVDRASLRKHTPRLKEIFAQLAARRTGWTPERRALARQLARENLTAAEIGQVIGATKHAVQHEINTNGKGGRPRRVAIGLTYCRACGWTGPDFEAAAHYRAAHGRSS